MFLFLAHFFSCSQNNTRWMKMLIFIFINEFFLSPIVLYCSFSCSLTNFLWSKLKAQTAVNQTGSLIKSRIASCPAHDVSLSFIGHPDNGSPDGISRYWYLHGQLRYRYDKLGLRTRSTVQPLFKFSYIPKANLEAVFWQEVCICFLRVFVFGERFCHCYRFRRR